MIFKSSDTPKNYNSIPKQIELYGRTIRTIDNSEEFNCGNNYGEARYGINEIGLSDKLKNREIDEDEIKLTYLHEMLHFILNFTGYEKAIQEGEKIDLEQFIELLSVGIYQYERSAIY